MKLSRGITPSCSVARSSSSASSRQIGTNRDFHTKLPPRANPFYIPKAGAVWHARDSFARRQIGWASTCIQTTSSADCAKANGAITKAAIRPQTVRVIGTGCLSRFNLQ